MTDFKTYTNESNKHEIINLKRGIRLNHISRDKDADINRHQIELTSVRNLKTLVYRIVSTLENP